MGVQNGVDLAATKLDFSLMAPGVSPAIALRGAFNLTLGGDATGVTAQLERSFDEGATWHACTQDGVVVSLTGPLSEVCQEPEAGVLYRLRVTAITGGTLQGRFSQ